jgi:hypothetical protein
VLQGCNKGVTRVLYERAALVLKSPHAHTHTVTVGVTDMLPRNDVNNTLKSNGYLSNDERVALVLELYARNGQ